MFQLLLMEYELLLSVESNMSVSRTEYIDVWIAKVLLKSLVALAPPIYVITLLVELALNGTYTLLSL